MKNLDQFTKKGETFLIKLPVFSDFSIKMLYIIELFLYSY